MNIKRAATFLIALLVGGLGAASLLGVSSLRQAEGIQMALRAADEPEKADALIDRAAQLLSRQPALGAEAARRLLERDRPALALRLLTPLTTGEQGRDEPLIWGILARAAKVTGDERRADEARKQARRAAQQQLATVGKAKVGDSDAAQRFLRLGLHLSDPESGGDASEALLALREAVRIAPKEAATLNGLGYVLAEKARTPQEREQAVLLTAEALKRAPESGIILDSYGWALLKRGNKGDDARARRFLREAVEREPQVAEIRYHLALAYFQAREFDAARIELEWALRLNPKDALALELKRRLPPTAPSPSPTPGR